MKTAKRDAETQDRMPSIKERYSKKQVEDAIVRCSGRWAAVVNALNCSYAQLRVWMDSHPDHKKLAEGLREAIVDEAENEAWEQLRSPDPEIRREMAKFVLKTLGKSRGWGEGVQAKREIEVKDGKVDIREIFGI